MRAGSTKEKKKGEELKDGWCFLVYRFLLQMTPDLIVICVCAGCGEVNPSHPICRFEFAQ